MKREGHRERLREKFLKGGMDSLADYEKIELLLSFVIIRKDTKELAKLLFEKYGTLSNILDAPFEELEKIPNMGKRSALLIKFLRALTTDYLKEKVKKEKVKINSPENLVNYLIAEYGDNTKERFSVVFLNSQNEILDITFFQEGTVNYSFIYPREIMKEALKKNATAIILVHNHPSGSLTPSDADIRITEKIKSLCDNMEISLLDHIIIAGKSFLSFRKENIF